MKKIYKWSFILIAVLTRGDPVYSQICDSITPVFTVDLTGQPNGTWISPDIYRDGYCCGVSGSDKCIEFIITLDSSANGINFNVASGAMPAGALFYQVNCGPPVAIGQPICLTGAGPHLLTFCKPGNNTNTYQITSIPQPSLNGTQWVSQACTGNMIVTGLEDTSITWTSVPYNATYNSFLSCTNNCNTVTVTPSGGTLPAYVDYQVCGNVIGACQSLYFCDTIRINFVNNLAVAIAPQNPVICFGGPNATVTANPNGGLAPYNYLWSNGATTQSITVGAGTYTVQMQDSVSCSLAYDSVTVTALPSPISANAGPDQIFCTNQQSVNLNGSVIVATGGSWYGGSGTFSPDNTTLNASYTPSSSEILSGNVQLMLVTTGNYSCPADTDIMVISISANPVPFITGNITVCENSTHIYTAPFVSGINYQWSVNGGNIMASNINSITVQWGIAGNGTISLTETNAQGCDSLINIQVLINPNPTPIINGPQSVCTTTTSQYTVANPVTGSSYNWSVLGGTISGPSNNSSVSVLWSAAGNATITVTESNSYGCDSTVMIPVTILTIPAPVISGPVAVCEFQTMTYSTPYVAGNTYNWNVTGGNIISNNNNSITVNWPSPGNGSITVTEANTLTCDSTVTINVTVSPQPVPVINGPPLICTSTYAQYSVSNPIAGDSYNWAVSGGTIIGSASDDNITVIWTNAGTGIVSVNESNNFGCDSLVSLSIDVKLKPAPVLGGPPVNCEMDTTTYSVQDVIGDTYLWNVTGGSIIGLTVGSSIEVLWTSPGTGEVRLRQINPDGCDSIVSRMVTINPLPQPVISGPAVICEDEPAMYNVLFQSSHSYSWNVSFGNIIGSSSLNNVNVNWNNSGIGNLSVIQTTPQGCSKQAEFLVLINEKPQPSVVGNNVGCISNASYNYSSVNEPGTNYLWTVTGGNISTGNGSSEITVQWITPGLNAVSVTALNTFTGCDSTSTIYVFVDSLAHPVIETSGLSGCVPVKIEFNGNLVNPNYQYVWNFGDGTAAYTANPYHQYTKPGTYSVQVIATNNTGCADTAYAEVNAYSIPSADFSLWYGDKPYYAGLSMLTIENQSAGASVYSWDFGDNSFSSLFEPKHDYTEPGNYIISLSVSNQWGCRDSNAREIIVKLPEEIFIPNAFSPNNDHVNDYFSVSNNNITQLTIAIFNRWGERLYASNDLSFKWNGTFHNKPVEEGVYVYRIEAKGYHGKNFYLNGTVTLIR